MIRSKSRFSLQKPVSGRANRVPSPGIRPDLLSISARERCNREIFFRKNYITVVNTSDYIVKGTLGFVRKFVIQETE
jgi:hypothetical protein